MDETMNILEPRFGGTTGQEQERVCQKVEKLFMEYLQIIKENSEKILDVKQPTWYDDMFEFREHMKDLEMIVENLVTAAFKDVQTVQQGIDYLYGFKNYMNRQNLQTLFDRKTTLVSLFYYILISFYCFFFNKYINVQFGNNSLFLTFDCNIYEKIF